MALLYYVKIINPNGAEILAPSLIDTPYHAKLIAALVPPNFFKTEESSYFQIFENEASFMAYSNSIAMTAEESAIMTEWKNFNNITITYTVFETSSTITAPVIYGN